MEKRKSPFSKNIFNSRYGLYAMLLIIAIAFAGTYSKVYDVKLDLNGDNIHYYVLGKALAEGKGFTNIMSFAETPHTHFPPGYPLFVAGVMKIFPDNANAVKIANGLLLLTSLLLLFFLLKRLSGSAFLPFLACFFCAMHAELLRYATIMMSEMLFLCCSAGVICLTLTIRPGALFTKGGKRDTLLFVLLLFGVNYIYFVRTMGTSLVLAVILYAGILLFKQFLLFLRERGTDKRQDSLRRMFRYGLFFLLLAVSFAGTKAAWDMRNKRAGKTQSDYVGDFLKKEGGEVMATWSDWKGRLSNNFVAYTTKYLPNAILFTPYNLKTTSAGEIVRGIAVFLLLLVGLFRLKEGGALLLFLYLGATFAVLLVWPEQYGGIRYFIATVPFLVFLFFYGTASVIRFAGRLRKKGLPSFLPAACAAAIAMIFMFPAYGKASTEKKALAKYKSWTPEIAGNAFAEFVSAMEWCGKNLPATARPVCRKSELYFFYSGGRKCGGFSQYGKPEEILQQLIDQKATHVIIDHWFRHAYVTLYPLILTHYPEKFTFIGKFELQGKKNDEPPTLVYEFHPER